LKVLLDTDIGSDIDDAVCLASGLYKVAGREIPIFPGAEKPLLVPLWQPRAPQARAARVGSRQAVSPWASVLSSGMPSWTRMRPPLCTTLRWQSTARLAWK